MHVCLNKIPLLFELSLIGIYYIYIVSVPYFLATFCYSVYWYIVTMFTHADEGSYRSFILLMYSNSLSEYTTIYRVVLVLMARTWLPVLPSKGQCLQECSCTLLWVQMCMSFPGYIPRSGLGGPQDMDMLNLTR